MPCVRVLGAGDTKTDEKIPALSEFTFYWGKITMYIEKSIQITGSYLGVGYRV